MDGRFFIFFSQSLHIFSRFFSDAPIFTMATSKITYCTLMSRYLFWLSNYFAITKKVCSVGWMCVVLHKCNLEVLQYVCDVAIVTWPISVSCVASLSFTSPFSWPHGKVNCPSYSHLRISLVVVGHPGLFSILSYDYCEFGHTSFVPYFFSPTI